MTTDLVHKPSKRSLSVLAAFTGAYMLSAIIWALASGNAEFIFYIVVMLVLIGAVLFVHSRVTLTIAVLWCLSIWGFLHMAGGLVPVPESWPIDGDVRVLYSWWIIPGPEGSTPGDGTGGYLKYDQITHAFGFGTTTWLCWQAFLGAMRAQFPGRVVRPTLGLMVLMAVAGAGFGALNEVVEFIATRLSDTNVGGYVNTGLDLIFNTVGTVTAASAIYIRSRITGPRARSASPPATPSA